MRACHNSKKGCRKDPIRERTQDGKAKEPPPLSVSTNPDAMLLFVNTGVHPFSDSSSDSSAGYPGKVPNEQAPEEGLSKERASKAATSDA